MKTHDVGLTVSGVLWRLLGVAVSGLCTSRDPGRGVVSVPGAGAR